MDIDGRIQELVELWCDRRELGALATILPHWLANNGLPTDGVSLEKLCVRLLTTNGFRLTSGKP